MDLIKYKVFLNIAERGSYSRVCEEFGYTQSGISRMMSSMENEIGFPLIIRNNKGISLTDEGQRLIPLIRNIVRDNELIEDELAAIRGLETGRVRIGSFPTTAYAWIPDILKGFHEKFPGIQVEVIEDNNINLLENWLIQGYVDLGVFSRQEDHHFDWLSLRKDPFVALLPEGHPLADREVVPVNELVKEKVVLFKAHDGDDPDTYGWMGHVDHDWEPVFTTNSDFTTIRVVEENGFVTVLPKLMAEHAVKNYNVVYRPMDIDEAREIGIAVRSKNRLSPAVEKFIKYAKEDIF